MRSSLKTVAGMGLLLTLTACGTSSKKESSTHTLPMTAGTLSPRAEADYHFILGDLYSREGKSDLALSYLEKALSLDGDSSPLHMRLAIEHLQKNRLPQAIHHAEQAVAKDAKNIEARIMLGGLYTEDKRPELAREQYEAVLALDPKNGEAPVYIGSLYAEKKDFKKAEQHFLQLTKNPDFPSPHLAHFYVGLTRIDQGEKFSGKAEEAFKQALALNPRYADAAFSLAKLYLKKDRKKALNFALDFQQHQRFNGKLGNFIAEIYLQDQDADKANEQLSYIAMHAPVPLDLQMKMALLLIEQKRFHQAEASLKTITEKHPGADGARYYLAAIYEEIGESENAVREYQRVPASSTHFSNAVVHAAHLLKKQGHLKQALALTEKALKTKGVQPQVYLTHASFLEARSQLNAAARTLEQGLAGFAKDTRLLFQHAVLLDRLGKKDAMMAQMKKLLEIEPGHVQGLSYLAFNMAELNQQLDEAETLARRASELEPADGYVLDTLGWVLYKQKKYAEAVAVLEKAHSLQGSASIIAQHLAEAYSMMARTDEVQLMFKKAAELAKNAKHMAEMQNGFVQLD